jgi:hypothetical protein
MEELRELRDVAFSDERHGADLRLQAAACVRTPVMRLRLAESDRLMAGMPGAARLRKRRRLGIPRHLSGPDRAFSIFQPDLEQYRTREAPEPRVFKHKDEFEWVVIPGGPGPSGWRPVKDELTFDEARAIAGIKAGTLYAYTAAREVPGQVCRQLGDDFDRNLHELRFRTEEFMKWAVVVGKSSKKSRRR